MCGILMSIFTDFIAFKSSFLNATKIIFGGEVLDGCLFDQGQ